MTQTVHRWLALLVVVTVAGPQLRAQSTDPEHVAQQYTEALRAGDWTHMAELMHPDALRELRILFDPLFDLPAANDALPELLGVRTLDEARALSDTGLFAGFMQFIVNQDPNVADALESADVDVLGHVREADDAHVVFRMTMEVQDIQMVQMDVITLRKSGDQWRGLLAGDLAAVAQAIRNQLGPTPDRR